MNPWLIASAAVVVIGSGWFHLWSRVSSYEGTQLEPVPRQGAIILGASLKDSQPGPALKERLDKALELYQRGLAPLLILSGGRPRGRVPEAKGMKEYLMNRGVRKQDLLLEDRSTNTAENLAHTRELLLSRGIRDVYLVTHDYHMYRAVGYARRAGVPVTPAPFATRSLRLSWHKSRECLALIKYFLQL